MALEVLKEVTVWDVEYKQPNHIYLMNGSRPIAYQKWGEGEPIYFKSKQKFDKRRRTFVRIPLKDSVFKGVKILGV
jgi:hypothetical protein